MVQVMVRMEARSLHFRLPIAVRSASAMSVARMSWVLLPEQSRVTIRKVLIV